MGNLQIRMRLWKENPYCFVCEKLIDDFSEATLEHIIPRSKGGKLHRNNLAVSHRFCNELKGNMCHREEWQLKLEEHEDQYNLILWRRSRSDHFVKNLICKSFAGVDFVTTSLDRFPGYFEKTIIPKQELSLQIQYITRLRKNMCTETLIQESKNIDRFRTRPYWKIIFGLLLLESYLTTKDIMAVLHATWRLSTFRPEGRSLILYSYSRDLLDLCRYYEPEAYDRFISTGRHWRK